MPNSGAPASALERLVYQSYEVDAIVSWREFFKVNNIDDVSDFERFIALNNFIYDPDNTACTIVFNSDGSMDYCEGTYIGTW